MCLVNEQMHCRAGAKKGTPSAKRIVTTSLSMYLSLSHRNVLLPYKLYKSVAGKNRPTFDPICRSFLCLACLVCLVFEVAQLRSCTAGTKEERGKRTNCAKWEKAERHHLVLSLSNLVQKFFCHVQSCHVQSSNVESSVKSFTKPNASQALWSQTLVEWMIFKSTNLGKLLVRKFWKENEEEDCTGNAWDMTSIMNGRKNVQCLNIASKTNGEAWSKTIWHTIPFVQTWYFRDFLSATVRLLQLPVHCSKSWTLAATEGQATKNSTMQLLDWCRNETYQSRNKREITWRE